MTEKWLEINEASSVLDIELQYLCDLVIDGKIKTTTCDNALLVDIESVESDIKSCYFENARSIDSLKEELERLKVECAWLKSENMMNLQKIKDYHTRFSELQKIKDELIEVINHQSETIRALKGYHMPVISEENSVSIRHTGKYSSGISLWMFLPVLGLAIAAAVEIIKTNHIFTFDAFLRYLGMM